MKKKDMCIHTLEAWRAYQNAYDAWTDLREMWGYLCLTIILIPIALPSYLKAKRRQEAADREHQEFIAELEHYEGDSAVKLRQKATILALLNGEIA